MEQAFMRISQPISGLPLLLAMLCCFITAPVFAGEAGFVTFLSGAVSVLSPDGTTRILYKGAPLNQGDTAITGKNGRIEVRFSDDAQVKLHPGSQFRIDEYSYKGKVDGNERGIFSLLKGSLRTITGMIGKANRSAYSVVTPTATIGIRGTEYTATVENGLRVSVIRGEISLDNNAGSFAVSEGQSAFVSSVDTAPKYLQSDSAAAGRGSNSGAASGTRITGNTRIDAKTSGTTAVAAGQGNKAANQAGVIGGE
ncbi:MAG TPA: FecR family protein [Rhodocyclaceae bacterium]|nr:FecR family protein [Rhodocyclaceae bacterium]